MKIQQERITAVQAGDKFKLTYPGLQPTEITVAPACSDKFSGHWWCITHQTGFENQFQKDTHIGTGKHKMVWHCSGHGFEQP